LGYRLEVLGAFIILSAAIFAVLSRGSISGGIVGLSITYALQVISAYVLCVSVVSGKAHSARSGCSSAGKERKNVYNSILL